MAELMSVLEIFVASGLGPLMVVGYPRSRDSSVRRLLREPRRLEHRCIQRGPFKRCYRESVEWRPRPHLS